MILRFKICCISNEEEARMAVEYGAWAIGLVARMPSGPGPISDELIRQIAKTVPPPVATFMLTSETSVNKIIEHHHRTNTNTIQIVDSISSGSYGQFKSELPNVKIVQVIHVINERSVDEAIEISEQVDAILLDSGNPKLKIKELGGTGRVHNWQLSRLITDKSKCPARARPRNRAGAAAVQTNLRAFPRQCAPRQFSPRKPGTVASASAV